LKQNDSTWNGIVLNFQRRRRAEPYFSAGKIMRIVFWVAEACILIHFLPRKETVNAVCYIHILQKL
jgi:hypothetical protein